MFIQLKDLVSLNYVLGYFKRTTGAIQVAGDSLYDPRPVILHKPHSLGFVVLLGDIQAIAGSLSCSTIALTLYDIDTTLSASSTIGTTTNEIFFGNLFSLPVISCCLTSDQKHRCL